MSKKHRYNQTYTNEHLNQIAFPLGGIGAGMMCLEGTGALSHFSLRGKPNVFNTPLTFSALCVKGETNVARVLEGPVPKHRVFGHPNAGSGQNRANDGLPRCTGAVFKARFPFATITLKDATLTLKTTITGWSPFVPGDADGSSLPVAVMEYAFANTSDKPVEAVYSFHSANVFGTDERCSITRTADGFVCRREPADDAPWEDGSYSATVKESDVSVSAQWFRGGWFDPLTMIWKSVADGATPDGEFTDGEPSRGASLYVPFTLPPGKKKTITLNLAWHAPISDIRVGADVECGCSSDSCDEAAPKRTHSPWYAGTFPDIAAVKAYWKRSAAKLRRKSKAFGRCFHDTTLPDEVVEAISANLSILKSPTVMRQPDGRLWTYEGCTDNEGCCHGSCTHVWNYAQAIPHLFPDLERTLRRTEFHESQDERGHQEYRVSLPIRSTPAHEAAPADGQCGGIMKMYRDWRISGDTEWLRSMWPRVRQSLDYCIELWDPDHEGVLREPQFNTYDIFFWGRNGMCTSFYLGALKAAVAMADALGDDAPLYTELLDKGRNEMESDLWNGKYFFQKIQWDGLRAKPPSVEEPGGYSPEALAIMEKEGPKYQYGDGCLSDGVLGAWLGMVCGVGEFLDEQKVESHLLAVYEHNFREDLSRHANPQRPTYALGDEAGLLLCSWPRGGELSLPFVYSNEVWTGIEYQVASHLMALGHVDKGLDIVRAVRDRYDGRWRNPFDEYECGHWYARALSSYAMIQGLTGVRYDAVDKVLHLAPRIDGDFRAFLCTATGFGTVGVKDGEPFVEVKSGTIPFDRIAYSPREAR